MAGCIGFHHSELGAQKLFKYYWSRISIRFFEHAWIKPFYSIWIGVMLYTAIKLMIGEVSPNSAPKYKYDDKSLKTNVLSMPTLYFSGPTPFRYSGYRVDIRIWWTGPIWLACARLSQLQLFSLCTNRNPSVHAVKLSTSPTEDTQSRAQSKNGYCDFLKVSPGSEVFDVYQRLVWVA